MQPWEYVYDLLMPAEMPPEQQKFTKYIYLTLAVPKTKEFEEKISKGYTENLELPVYPVAFDTERAKFNGDRIATKKDLLTGLGLYANDYAFTAPLKDLDFNASIPGYFPLTVLKLYFEGGIEANPEDYGLKPIDSYKWEPISTGSYKVTGGLLFDITKAKNNGRYSVLNLGDNPKEFNTLNGYGIARFGISLKNAPPEVYTKTKEECESAGGVYYYDAGEEIAYCTFPLNKETNTKASEFILQLNEMIKSKITSENFLKLGMVYQLPGPKMVPVKPVIGKTFEDMVKVADKDLLLKEIRKEEKKETKQETGKEEEEKKETKQESQEQLFNPFAIDEAMLTEGKQEEAKQENSPQQQNPPAEAKQRQQQEENNAEAPQQGQQQQNPSLKMNILTEEESNKSEEKQQPPENNIQTFGFKGGIADFFASLVKDKYIFLPILSRRSPSEYRNAKKQRTFKGEAVEEHTEIPHENMKYAEFRKRYSEVINKYAVPFMHNGIWAILPGREQLLYKELDRLVQEGQKLGISPEEIEFMVTVLLVPKDIVVREINRQTKEIRTDIDEVKQELQNPDLKKNQITSLKKQLEQKQLRLDLLKGLYSTVTNEEMDKLAGKVKDTLYTLRQIAKYVEQQQEEENNETEEEEEEEEEENNTVKLS
ncbi:structural protein [Acidianus two-tailed virus 2]|nr:structural protein [Acidianus two-tailed virus 2]